MKRVYLCSRVAYEARPNNEIVAQSLEAAGFDVYVPHRMAPNNLSEEDIREGRYDVATIFKMDYGAMLEADICVAVGRLGSDCAWEIAVFRTWNIPIVYVPFGDDSWKKSPMLIPSLSACIIDEPADTGAIVREQVGHVQHRLRVEVVDASDGCILWDGFRETTGYGRIPFLGTRQGVHRLALTFAQGRIPPNALVCHKCDVRNCINPAHLYIGDYETNAQDAVARKRHTSIARMASRPQTLCTCGTPAKKGGFFKTLLKRKQRWTCGFCKRLFSTEAA